MSFDLLCFTFIAMSSKASIRVKFCLHHVDPHDPPLKGGGSRRVKNRAVLPIFDPDPKVDPRVK